MTTGNWITIALALVGLACTFGGFLLRLHLKQQSHDQRLKQIEDDGEKRDGRTARIEDLFHALNLQVATGFAKLEALLKEKQP